MRALIVRIPFVLLGTSASSGAESAMVRQMEALEATLAEERRTARAKEARHKLIVERLRRQIVELQVRAPALHLVPC